MIVRLTFSSSTTNMRKLIFELLFTCFMSGRGSSKMKSRQGTASGSLIQPAYQFQQSFYHINALIETVKQRSDNAQKQLLCHISSRSENKDKAPPSHMLKV